MVQGIQSTSQVDARKATMLKLSVQQSRQLNCLEFSSLYGLADQSPLPSQLFTPFYVGGEQSLQIFQVSFISDMWPAVFHEALLALWRVCFN